MKRTKEITIILLSLFVASTFCFLLQSVQAAPVFADSYEAGNYSAWTGTVNTGSQMLITSTGVYDGIYSAHCSLNNAYQTYAYAFYNFSAATIMYHREYVKISDLPTQPGTTVDLFGIMDDPRTTHLATIGIDNNGGIYRWKIKYYNNTIAENGQYSTAVDIQPDTWYYIEIMVRSGNGTGQVATWIAKDRINVNQALPTMNLTNIINNDVPIETIFFGGYISNGWFPDGSNLYSDDVVASATWTGPRDWTNPTVGSISASNIVAGTDVTLNSTITDTSGVDYVIPSWNNTGTWVNQTAINSGDSLSFQANFAGTWNNTVGSVVSVKFYANDTLNNWGSSSQFDFTLIPPKVATPTFSPAQGTYSSSQSVAISCGTAGATIRYTTDGSEPTSSSTAYSDPISVSATTTVKAKAFKSGMTDSDTATATYTVETAALSVWTIAAVVAIVIAIVVVVTWVLYKRKKSTEVSVEASGQKQA